MHNGRTSWTADDLGPAMVAFLRPCPGVEAIVVVDNVALGAAIGGVRMRPEVTAGEVARLARAMTLNSVRYGIWGGLNQADRSLERRRRARKAIAA